MRIKDLLFVSILFGLICFGCKEPENGPAKEEVDYVKVRSTLYSVEVPAPEAETYTIKLTAEQQAYVKNGNDFAFRLMKLIRQKDKGSFVFSPLSIQYALMAAANAAQGETAQELLSFLAIGENVEAINEYSRTLLEQLAAVDFDVKAQMANVMVMKDGFTLSQEVKETIQNNYYTPVVTISFREPNGAAVVNEWFRQRTENALADIMAYDSPQPTVCYLLSGMHYKANWNRPFIGILEDAPFYADSGEQHIDYFNQGFLQYLATLDKGRILMFKNGKSGFNFNILLPTEGNSLDSVLAPLEETSWTNALKHNIQWAGCYTTIPVLATESSYKLKDIINEVPMKAFDSGLADFSALVSEPDFYLDDILHKAKVSVGNTGVSPGTGVIGKSAISQPSGEDGIGDIVADHPFAYFITEQTSGAIILAGVFAGE
jgi:serpin B